MSQLPTIIIVEQGNVIGLALEELRSSADADLIHVRSHDEMISSLAARSGDLALVVIDGETVVDGLALAGLVERCAGTHDVPILYCVSVADARVREWARTRTGGFADVLAGSPEPWLLRSRVGLFLQLAAQKRMLANAPAPPWMPTSEARLRAMVDNISQLAWMARPDGYIYWYNRRWYEYTGSTPEQMEGWGWQSVHDPKVLPMVLERWRAAIAEGEPFEMEFPLRRADGRFSRFLTRAFPLKDDEGKVIEWFGTNTDVTGLVDAREALRASEARLSLLSRTAGELLRAKEPQAAITSLCQDVMSHLDCQAFFNFLVDPATQRLRLNACAGIPPEEAQRIQWLDGTSTICACVARQGARLISEDIAHNGDRRADLVRRYGIQAYCCHPLLGPSGQVLGTLSFGTKNRTHFTQEAIDVMRVVADQVATAIEQMEARRILSMTNAQLQEADLRKNEFMAMLSHELRNPLAPIKNCLHVIDHAEPGSPQALRAKAVLDRQVNQLSRLVDDLLDVTRITRNKIQLRRSRVELCELTTKTVDDYRSEFENKGVALELRHGAHPIWMLADWNRVAQALGNLLQNAVKFTPRGGRVVVSTTHDALASQAVIQVVDDGVGLSAEMLGRLFQPFMQADTTLDRSRGGLGLGLVLVKAVVELHGGTVDAQSAGLGQGTSFTVRLPAELPAMVAMVKPSAAVARRKQRVLIVEDNIDAADSLRALLELEGHEVDVAYNGPNGVAKALELVPTVILCDIGLPGMDGYQVAQALRAHDRLDGTRLVALTGYALPEDLQRAKEAGFDEHMAKPPSLEQLTDLFDALKEPPQIGGRPFAPLVEVVSDRVG